jgi:hypothetical protein
MDTEDRYTRITLRIPKALHEHLAESAEQSSKSMNAEIIARLEESYFNHQSPAERYTQEQFLKMLVETQAGLVEKVRLAVIERDAKKGYSGSDAAIDFSNMTELFDEDEIDAMKPRLKGEDPRRLKR